MKIALKRVYEKASPADGYRVLVDRLWPRGMSKANAHLDEWLKCLAPSEELRKWFGHDPARWGEFRMRYVSELKHHREQLRALAATARKKPVTLVFAARDEERNNAVVIKQYLQMLGPR